MTGVNTDSQDNFESKNATDNQWHFTFVPRRGIEPTAYNVVRD
jgi:hypothetical protein